MSYCINSLCNREIVDPNASGRCCALCSPESRYKSHTPECDARTEEAARWLMAIQTGVDVLHGRDK